MSTDGKIFGKFKVARADGSDSPGGKHEGCEYFVLDLTHDQHAKPALSAYANACEATHPLLAADLRQRYALAACPAREILAVVQEMRDVIGKSNQHGWPQWLKDWANRLDDALVSPRKS